MEEALQAISMFSSAGGDAVPNIPKRHRAQLSRNGVKICLDGLRSSTDSNFCPEFLAARNALLSFVMELESLNKICPPRT